MSDKGNRKCPYIKCYLPDDNKKYIVQFGYLALSIVFLIKDSAEFTFFSILMFTAPILIDLISTDLKGKIFNSIKNLYILVNGGFVVFCIAGLGGFFIDDVNNFSIIKSAMILPGASFDKKYLLIPMVFDLLIPITMFYACPSKKMKETIKQGRQQRKAGI